MSRLYNNSGKALGKEGGENMLRKIKGQSTLEYVALFMLVVIVIVALIYAAVQPGVKKMIENAGSKITNAATSFGTQAE